VSNKSCTGVISHCWLIQQQWSLGKHQRSENTFTERTQGVIANCSYFLSQEKETKAENKILIF